MKAPKPRAVASHYAWYGLRNLPGSNRESKSGAEVVHEGLPAEGVPVSARGAEAAPESTAHELQPTHLARIAD
jgi:hypothetical protein